MIISKKYILGAVLLIPAIILLLSSILFIPEGHSGVVLKFGKATRQIEPGLNFKFPFVESVELIEVRQRKNEETLAAATFDQLPINVAVSINWTVNKTDALELFIEYGGLNQFENRILDPKLRSASKAALAKYPAPELIRNRNIAVNAIFEEMQESLKLFPVTVNSPQIENIEFPQTYRDAVTAKEQAKQEVERERQRLEKQRLESQQLVNTAKAEAESKQLAAKAEAFRITTVAKAEADAVRIIADSLSVNKTYVDYVRATRWNGTLPSTLVSESAGMLISTSPDK